MNNNPKSTDSESFDQEALIRAETHFEPTGSNTESSSGNDDRDIRRRQHRPPLGVALTGYRLFAICMILGPGIAKAVYSYRGRSLISTTMDWVAGIVIVILLFWLGVIEAEHPELSPAFFQTDLVVLCLRFLSRDRVRYWFQSIGFVFYGTMPLLLVLGSRCDEEQSCRPTAHFIKAALALSVLALSAYISIFYSIYLRVLRPTDFEEYHRFLRITNLLMWMTCNAYFQAFMIAVIVFRKDLKYNILEGIALGFVYNFAGMLYGNKFVLKEDAGGNREGPSPHIDLKVTMAVTFLTTMSVFVVFLGLLDLRLLLAYVVPFTFVHSCFVLVILFRSRSFSEALKSGVSFITDIWSAIL